MVVRLFTSEERERIYKEVAKIVLGEGKGTAAARQELESILPSQPPNWDPNTTGGRDAPLQYRWTLLRGLKAALVSAPALALPNLGKPFQLFVAENGGIAKGVLTQALGPWGRPVAYLSRRLDPVASGWPACLRALAATAMLVKEARAHSVLGWQ